MLCIVAYIDSWYIDQLFVTSLLPFVDIKLIVRINEPAIAKYRPIFVNDIDKFPNTGASKLNRSLISN